VLKFTVARLGACLLAVGLAMSARAQTVTVLGVPHLTGLSEPPSSGQLAHVVELLAAFEPTQVCVERMSGERIEMQLAEPEQHGMTFQPETHGRPLATVILPAGVEMQMILERRASEARSEAEALIARWEELEVRERIRAIALQVAGFEFHSAVLNWSYLDDSAWKAARGILGARTADTLSEMLDSVHEVYSLGVPLSRNAGLHALCTADALENETRGMRAAWAHGGDAVLDDPQVQARFAQLTARQAEAWQPKDGDDALAGLLRFTNGEEFAALDRRLQWETLREFDNEERAFRRRLMYWHARTAEISSGLFRALAEGPEERVLLIIGAAHRPFTEADLRSQPWVEVAPALSLLEGRVSP
jgi:hypothetical protein